MTDLAHRRAGLPPLRRVHREHPWRMPILVVAVILSGLAVRSPITVMGPLGQQIGDAYGLSAAGIGALTTVTLVVFVVASPFATTVGRRLGIELSVVLGFLIVVAGAVVRTLPSTAALYVGTVLVALGLCLPNVLLPMVIRRDFPRSIGTMTALFTSTMTVSGALGSFLALPLTSQWGWHVAITVIPAGALLAAVLWLPFEREHHQPDRTAGVPAGSLWRSPLAWQVTAFFGMQSLMFYTAVAWLVPMLTDRGMSAAAASGLLGMLALIGMVPSLLVPPIAARGRDQVVVAALIGLVQLVGGVLVATTTGAALAVGVLVVGVGSGAGMSLAYSFLGLRTGTSMAAGRLAGMSQSGGYAIAALGPVLVGLAHEWSGSWSGPRWTYAIVGLATLTLGMLAGRARRV
ncbi:MFS transporter [Barrientosiimonas humi]|uniref:MFS transporter n=1 Tax=Barrientosiimonas humi TaxID=999931 RepID=UPI00370D1013